MPGLAVARWAAAGGLTVEWVEVVAGVKPTRVPAEVRAGVKPTPVQAEGQVVAGGKPTPVQAAGLVAAEWTRMPERAAVAGTRMQAWEVVRAAAAVRAGPRW